MLFSLMATVLLGQSNSNTVRTKSFYVQADTPEMSKKIAEKAESYRREIAQEWFGEDVPDWGFPHIIQANVKEEELGVNQSILLVFNLITVQGDETNILYSSLPHEICHSVMKYKLGVWIPRWADEGMAMLSEREDLGGRSNKFLTDQAGTEPICEFLVRREYPIFFRQSFYGQAYSFTKFLVEKKGKRTFTAFLRDAREGDWAGSAQTHYGYGDLYELEADWKTWHLNNL